MSQVVQLWRRLRAGAAFEQCVRPHVPRLYNLAWRLTRSAADAEDLVQEALTRAYTRREQLLTMESPGAWLARVVHNAWVDRWRRQGVLRDAQSLDDDSEDRQPAISDATVLDAVEAAGLMRAVMRLPEHHQLVILLHDAAGYTLEEVAEAVGTPVGTAKSRLHRARQSLRAMFADGTVSSSVALSEDRRHEHEMP
ncbi:RNA polymerase sigma-70 factor (ECF subfamily) [Natronocella acetinitrilica]|uniref:RNA polymerase sigma-70 factor (ECF subfamily) n=1 Tax=Natronocella acetinitrilica TaxID=414046 RepID=A0AAE3G6G6_9GAMM|nr:RNA polymerase sigma factor [Natronocella acetinitrilica]MCP1675998.1 RNA polymerase sigma-70 factor (ECF subfamily) [Natronocella acetinitrilica]